MASILTHANIADATSAIETYVSTADGIYQSLQGTLNSLTASNWNGDGAVGCKEFFNGTVTPALTDGVTSIGKALKDILANIQDTLLDQLDPQLGDGNKNPGGDQ
jgi:uncharacterized protein YukE